jgi:hypothetical protein
VPPDLATDATRTGSSSRLPRNGDQPLERCPDHIWADVDKIDGWLYREEADLLWRLAEAPWCEIGTYQGRSATVFAAKGPGYCVDLFEPWYEQPSLPPDVILVSGDYREVADEIPGDLGFLYLDGDHSYQATREAFRLYAPKVRAGGHVVLHDVFPPDEWPGCHKAALELARELPAVAAAGRCLAFRKG